MTTSANTKVCTGCRKEKPFDDFHKDARHSTGRYYLCKPCKCAKQQAYRLANLDKVAASKRKSSYGLSSEHYDTLLKNQGGVCAVCQRPERAVLHGKVKELAVDHCHKTGKVRGLLCSTCNTGLGKFNDDVTMLERAIKYLRREDM